MIDLLPSSGKNMIHKEYRLRVFTVCFAMLALILVTMLISLLPTYLFVTSRYEAFLIESQSDETQNRISQVKEMETNVRETNKKIDSLKGGATGLQMKDVFLEILQHKNPGVSITSLSYDSGGVVTKKGKEDVISPAIITIQGRSSDRAALLAFKDSLVQKKEFAVVDLPIASLVKDTDLSFSINVTLAAGLSGKTK